jgi:hypothetical protein
MAFWKKAKRLYIDLAKKYMEHGLLPVSADFPRQTRGRHRGR